MAKLRKQFFQPVSALLKYLRVWTVIFVDNLWKSGDLWQHVFARDCLDIKLMFVFCKSQRFTLSRILRRATNRIYRTNKHLFFLHDMTEKGKRSPPVSGFLTLISWQHDCRSVFKKTRKSNLRFSLFIPVSVSRICEEISRWICPDKIQRNPTTYSSIFESDKMYWKQDTVKCIAPFFFFFKLKYSPKNSCLICGIQWTKL